MTVVVVFIVVMFALGLVILSGKGDNLIAGYNTASEEERREVNVKRLRIVVAGICILTPVLIGIPFFIGKEGDASLHLFTVFCVILMTFIGLVLANTWCKRK
jgi:drug/metabolite transporter (DMT)-like permease